MALLGIPAQVAPRLVASWPLHTQRMWGCKRTSFTSQSTEGRNGAHVSSWAANEVRWAHAGLLAISLPSKQRV